jgi:hypothetical protein
LALSSPGIAIGRFAAVAALLLAFGLGYTVFSEWLNIVVRRSWAYSSLMPVVSLVPTLALYAARRAATREEALR